jgi:hypothetical protein
MNFLLPSFAFARRRAVAAMCIASRNSALFMPAQNDGEPPGLPVS